MQKILFSLFVGLGYLLQLLKRPAAWAVITLVAAGLWWKHQRTESAKVVHQREPVEFKALVLPTPPAGAEAAAPGTEPVAVNLEGVSDEIAAAIAEGVTDPEQLPVMSSRELEKAVGRFHKDNLRLPKDADELIEKKYLVGVPPAPPGKTYLLDLSPIRMRLVRK